MISGDRMMLTLPSGSFRCRHRCWVHPRSRPGRASVRREGEHVRQRAHRDDLELIASALKKATIPGSVLGAGLDGDRDHSVSHRDAVDNGAVRIKIDLIDFARIRRIGDADDIDGVVEGVGDEQAAAGRIVSGDLGTGQLVRVQRRIRRRRRTGHIPAQQRESNILVTICEQCGRQAGKHDYRQRPSAKHESSIHQD